MPIAYFSRLSEDMGNLAGYTPLLDWHYWINPFPLPWGPSLVAQILGFFAFFLVAGIALHVVAHMLRKKDGLRADLLRRVGSPLLVSGFFGLLFLFFSYEQAPFLGMRFWYLLVLGYFFVRIGIVTNYAVREYPKRHAAQDEQRRISQYLPHKK